MVGNNDDDVQTEDEGDTSPKIFGRGCESDLTVHVNRLFTFWWLFALLFTTWPTERRQPAGHLIVQRHKLLPRCHRVGPSKTQFSRQSGEVIMLTIVPVML